MCRVALLAVPNISEGRDRAVLERSSGGFGAAPGSSTSTPTPTTAAASSRSPAPQGELAQALVGRRAAAALERIDLRAHEGLHPHVGRARRDAGRLPRRREPRRGRARRRSTAAALIGDELGLPVFLYGELATVPDHAERAFLRRGGPAELAARMEAGELAPDYGPARTHPTAGAVLATARPPLIAFNVDLDTDDVELAKRIAAELRESGGGLPGVRALGLYLAEPRARPGLHQRARPPRRAARRDRRARARAARRSPRRSWSASRPRAAFEGFPEDVPLRGFSPERHLIENALGRLLRVGSIRWPRPGRSARRKHRGTQAGTIDRAGRTSRPRTREDAKAEIAARAPHERLDKPPTLAGARSTGRRSPRRSSAC